LRFLLGEKNIASAVRYKTIVATRKARIDEIDPAIVKGPSKAITPMLMAITKTKSEAIDNGDIFSMLTTAHVPVYMNHRRVSQPSSSPGRSGNSFPLNNIAIR
jgi:hypothetical protein